MALREFVDRSGRGWTVWEMIPERMHERMRSTLGPFEAGWLVFECTTGEKRRLSPIPPGWDDLPATDLETLCGRATPARTLGDHTLGPRP
jgi:hypothetical protein